MFLKSEKLFKILSIIIFIIYILLLIWVVMFKCNLIFSISKTYEYFGSFTLRERFLFFIVPFEDYVKGPFLEQIDIIIEDDILNVAIFVPMGLYLTLFLKKFRLLKVVVITFSISLFFEVFQLFSLIGSFATKDLITNTLGAIIGYLACILLYRENNHPIKYIIFNIISIIVILIFMPILIYGIINTIKHFDVYVDVLLRKYVIPNN